MTFDEQATQLDHDEIVALLSSQHGLRQSNDALSTRVDELTRQLEWFKQQLFGSTSERRILDPDGRQLALGEWKSGDAPRKEITVDTHRRRSRQQPEEPTEAKIRFDERIPVEEIRLGPDTIDEDQEIVSYKETLKLAQRPASFVLLKYIRPVIKKKSDGAMSTTPAPPSVLGKSVADVSLLATMAIDKFCYHLPLYRQHQRMAAAGVHLARPSLTTWIQRTADLLQPIHQAQAQSILRSKVVTIDETPIKAGRKSRGKMKTAYFWPIYGDRDEIAFAFSDSRSDRTLQEVLPTFGGVMLTDGYGAYERFAARTNEIVHAQCWSHTRRQFLKAEQVEPELTSTALTLIRRLYDEDGKLKPGIVEGDKRAAKRAQRCRPIVDEFFEWLKTTLEEKALLPRNPFTEAANYALAREGPLRVFLQYPDVPIDTNHLEREIRPIALGRKNWLFCWTELGARDVGIFQSLLSTCRLQGVDPYVYLVDVLQRVAVHPASDVAALTPRLWKERFAENPMRSAIDREVNNVES